jgi:hypothetical protein
MSSCLVIDPGGIRPLVGRPNKHLFQTNVCLEPTDGGRHRSRSFRGILANARTPVQRYELLE